MIAKAILTDTTRCTGCEECVAACKRTQGLAADKPRRWKRAIDDLSATRFTTIIHRDGQSIRQQCRHCVDPACVSACLVGAMQKTPEGPVIYDNDRCMGCRYCMVACPFEIPRYEWGAMVPYVRKCSFCDERLADGRLPACVEACPHEATIFGDRASMLAEAHRRIREHPGRYHDKVYGEFDVGGTSVLMISDISLDFLVAGGGALDEALPDLTWAALKKVPGLALGVGGLMAGVFWITERRMRLQAEAQQAAGREGGQADAPQATGQESGKEQGQ